MPSGIYKIEHVNSGRVYIGSSINIDQRWAQHKKQLRANVHHSRYLQRAWNKYSENAFAFSIIENTLLTDLIKREQYWIDKFDAKLRFNLSPTAASSLGVKHTKEYGEKIRQRQLGKKASPETKQKMSLARQGSKNYFSKLTEKMVIDARKSIIDGETITKVAKELGVSKAVISKAVRGSSWKHVKEQTICVGVRKHEQHGMAKLNWDKVRLIKEKLSNGTMVKNIAKEFNIPESTIKDIKHDRTWREIAS